MKRSKTEKTAAFCVAALMTVQVIGAADSVQAKVVEKLAEQPIMEVFPEEEDTEAESAQPENAEKEVSSGKVRQQVNAPETYTADFSETLPVEGEDREIILHVKADIPVEVPETEAIRLKKATWATADEAIETAKNWESVLGRGIEGTLLETEEERTCDVPVETEEGPYEVRTTVRTGEHPENYLSYTMDWTKLELDKEGFRYLEDGKMLGVLDKTEQQEQAEISDRLAEVGLDMFQIRQAEPVVTRWAAAPEAAEDEPQVSIGHFYRCERLVDNVPITWIPGSWWFGEEEDKTEGVDGETVDQSYREESLTASYLHGRMTAIYYDGIMKVEDYSDEKLFLLPFEEIRQIFENTVADSVMTMPWGLPIYDELEIKYSDDYGSGNDGETDEAREQSEPAEQKRTLKLQIKRAVLGYMRVPDKENPDTGILIPVWDFTGSWIIPENAEGAEEYSIEEEFSILTIDARDGTIVQRWES